MQQSMLTTKGGDRLWLVFPTTAITLGSHHKSVISFNAVLDAGSFTTDVTVKDLQMYSIMDSFSFLKYLDSQSGELMDGFRV